MEGGVEGLAPSRHVIKKQKVCELALVHPLHQRELLCFRLSSATEPDRRRGLVNCSAGGAPIQTRAASATFTRSGVIACCPATRRSHR